MVNVSGVSNGSIPVDQPSRTAQPAADPAQQADAASPVQAEDVVALSSRTDAAAALLQGVAAADQPQADSEVQRLTKEVAAGTYRPEASKVATAMLSFERLIARKLGRD